MRSSIVQRLSRVALAAAVAFAIISIAKARAAEAQNLRVLPVPWVATDPTIPHQAYNGHATILKAIARGGDGASYTVEWDPEGDGTFMASFNTANRYNLGQTFTYPNQAVTTTFQAVVRVTSNGETVTGTYPVRVFADVPSDPATATDRQLQVMRSVSVDDALWYLHNQLTRTGNEEDPLTGAQASAYLPNSASTSYQDGNTAGALWALSLNGHFAAFPAAYIGEMPDAAANAQRWAQDPYAEDAMRLANNLLTQFTIYTNVAAADESNKSGFYPEVQYEPIYGTDDGVGFWVADASHDTYITGHVLAAFSVAGLKGYVTQVGDPTYVLGRRFEYITQQLVDGVVHAQIETAGVALGSWGYVVDQAIADSSTSLWGITGLWHADEFASTAGVIVPNIARARAAAFLVGNYTTGGAGTRCVGYRNGNTCGFTTTALHTLTAGWVGANTFDAADTRLAFPSYNALTRGQLRVHHNEVLAFINANFTSGYAGSIGWNQSFTMGHAQGFANTARYGNQYAMLHWQDAARANEPEIVTFGANNWIRLFSQYLINNQQGDGRWDSVIVDNNSDNYGTRTLQTVWAVLVLSPDAIPPLAIGTSNLTSTNEGVSIAFNGAASDPGSGNPVYTWDFDNGDSLSGQNVNYAFPDNGTFDVTLTSTSIGGTSVDTITVTIANVDPSASVGADLVANEGDAVPFGATWTDPGTDDTHTVAWNFGDGSPAGSGATTSHVYTDNGTFTATGTVTDDDGGADPDDQQVTINNVAPTITTTPGTTATEGQQYTYDADFTDPGTADTHTCTAPVMPNGMTLDDVTCTVTWTPNFAQSIGAAPPVRLCITDDDGGQTCQDWSITLSFVDTDNDGLPDSWEDTYWPGDLSHGAGEDSDSDGQDNLEEFQNGTSPIVADGPTAPTPNSPVCDSRIASLQTTLVVNNATDPQAGTPLIYTFELYGDVGLGQSIASDTNVAQGSGPTTSWPVPVNLLENHRYYWRANARDQYVSSPYSTVCSFFVNTINEQPGVPRINSPAFGGQVNLLRPNLVIDNATDIDEDVLTYTYEVYSDPALSQQVAMQAGVASGAGATTTWQVTVDLMEDRTYYWRARASDGSLSGDWSATGQFFVTTMNAPPEAPALVSPQNGTIVAELRPALVILNADDSDQDQVVYDWQLASDETFATIVASGTDQPAQGVINTQFALTADLMENGRYCWRARSDDGQATSAYNTACFLVSAVNDAPTVPTLNNPATGNRVLTTAPVFSWAPSTDPEGEPITYEVEVTGEGDTFTVTGVSGTVTSISAELDNGGMYSWRARAVDRSGAMSAFSSSNDFTVDAPIDDPEVVVNGGGCSTSTFPGAGGLAATGLALVGLLRRRRRR